MAPDVTVTFSARYADFMRDCVIDDWEICVEGAADHERCDRGKSIEELHPVDQIWTVQAEERLAQAQAMRHQALEWDGDDGVCTLTADPRALEHMLADALYCLAPEGPLEKMRLTDEVFAWLDLIRLLGDLGEQVRDARVEVA